MPFFGRGEELNNLQGLTRNPLAVATITGRRRVGKSRLVAEYARRERKQLVKIEGRDSAHADNAMQLAAFAADLAEATGLGGFQFATWNEAFRTLGQLCKGKRWVILLDEITWLARHSEECLAELKVFIDRHINGSGNRLIVCGSVSQWIEQYVNESDLFVGRISLKLRLHPLPLVDCARFWSDREVSPREILTALCVTGGVPRYLEAIDVRQSAEANIRRLCFEPSGYMVDELPNLIKSSFLGAAREATLERYLAILAALTAHGKTLAEIAAAARIENNSHLKNMMTALALSGIVSENPAWNLKDRRLQTRNIHYCVADPYTRFYMKYIRPHLDAIGKGQYRSIVLRQLAGWEAIRGLQFESLVVQNLIPHVTGRMGLAGVLIERMGPYFQGGTARHKAVQIDVLVQTADALYLCETKFRRQIEASAVDEVRDKVRRLAAPPNMTVRKVLLYSGERARALKESLYFDRQICVDDLLYPAASLPSPAA
jgi:predicted AAA+ superfamily ATPase